MNQREWIETNLRKGEIITPQIALKGCKTMRLAAHINTLRERGMNIITHTKVASNGSRYAAYQMLKGKKR